ncbi:MAG: phycobilisome protein [Geminocystis sp.]|nr:phycobilisome protein [Geminocystis sp.]HIK38746.1 phycobilisome protein [Geminocystis sp. M7585_C2015_104]MCS7148576.1 phycobilisome protein [Geminocystis sp.]MCX8078161.1 phycobilisome protein [Geminocystis sp.]MDW8115032.1 phycobilisome protein [Geminocystis sp.]
MYPLLQELIHEAESKYLQQSDLLRLMQEMSGMRPRLAVYRYLRDNEVHIFQKVADELLKQLPQEKTRNIENCLRHWLSITRYSAMAMLLNNPEYLQRRLLEWLTDIVRVYEYQHISQKLQALLVERLKEELPSDGFKYIEPFLNQAQAHIQNVQ